MVVGEPMTIKRFVLYFAACQVVFLLALSPFQVPQAAWKLGIAYKASLAFNQDELRKLKAENDKLKKAAAAAAPVEKKEEK
jgi:adenylate kinase